MSDLSFRIFFDGQAATVEDLASIERLSVDQSEGAAWEARIVMTLGLDAQGAWSGSRGYGLDVRTQVRVELKMGNADFAPLIDGPIVTLDSEMDSRPGRSTITITVHDDSAWLNRESGPISTDGRSVSQVAQELFLQRSSSHITSAQINFPSESSPSLGDSFADQGTAMQMLRSIAQSNQCRAYVLPGPTPGTSVGHIEPPPSPPASLPEMVLLGSGRNLLDVTVTEDPDSAQSATAHSLRLADQQILSYTTSTQDEELLGEDAAAPDAPTRQLRPGSNDSEDPEVSARAASRRTNDPVQFSGTLMARAYGAILTPYQVVTLRAGASRGSTLMRVTNVTHTITPDNYAVEFEGRGNSLSNVTGAFAGLPTGIF